ncbi:hypothetical protein BO71DRAFT_396662 [Aspergillus ellipticus CBS 707.79]|uniref:Uncharacterized protein n=1 Tax=Aspergillus ellipticus CBS 707.79 TaxID=1448320 RepID=A0A319DHC3_9EURO|nr:hypothetical protein BO71DRAFT_396662 [Aspergillus ellipticus CBS 707.79]
MKTCISCYYKNTHISLAAFDQRSFGERIVDKLALSSNPTKSLSHNITDCLSSALIVVSRYHIRDIRSLIS